MKGMHVPPFVKRRRRLKATMSDHSTKSYWLGCRPSKQRLCPLSSNNGIVENLATRKSSNTIVRQKYTQTKTNQKHSDSCNLEDSNTMSNRMPKSIIPVSWNGQNWSESMESRKQEYGARIRPANPSTVFLFPTSR
jgi:hypothetical protein